MTLFFEPNSLAQARELGKAGGECEAWVWAVAVAFYHKMRLYHVVLDWGRSGPEQRCEGVGW